VRFVWLTPIDHVEHGVPQRLGPFDLGIARDGVDCRRDQLDSGSVIE
jgi:hypothetical protein